MNSYTREVLDTTPAPRNPLLAVIAFYLALTAFVITIIAGLADNTPVTVGAAVIGVAASASAVWAGQHTT